MTATAGCVSRPVNAHTRASSIHNIASENLCLLKQTSHHEYARRSCRTLLSPSAITIDTNYLHFLWIYGTVNNILCCVHCVCSFMVPRMLRKASHKNAAQNLPFILFAGLYLVYTEILWYILVCVDTYLNIFSVWASDKKKTPGIRGKEY